MNAEQLTQLIKYARRLKHKQPSLFRHVLAAETNEDLENYPEFKNKVRLYSGVKKLRWGPNLKAAFLNCDRFPVCEVCEAPLKSYEQVTCSKRCSYASDSRSQTLSQSTKMQHSRMTASDYQHNREKSQQTSLERYGDTHYWKANRGLMSDHQNAVSADPKRKKQKLQRFKATSKERFGTDHPMQSEEVQEASRQTHLKVRGVSHQSKDPKVLSKILLSKKRRRDVEILGKSYRVQGYEHIVLKDLEHRITKLRTGLKGLPTFEYVDPISDSARTYFPDAVIKTKAGNRCVLEVKSPYTLCYQLETNLSKFKSAQNWCKANGWIFVLAVCDTKKNITYFKNPSTTEIRKYAKLLDVKVY